MCVQLKYKKVMMEKKLKSLPQKEKDSTETMGNTVDV